MDYVDMNKTNLGYQNIEALEELQGSGKIVEVFSCSDYDGFGEDSAMRDHVYEGWVARLKEHKCKYIELYGAHYTIWLFVKVVGNNGRKLKAYEHVTHMQNEQDNYPIWDDMEYSNKQWEYTAQNTDMWYFNIAGNIPEVDMIDMIMNVVSNGWAGNDANNDFSDRCLSSNYLHETSIKAGLKALGYRHNDDTDIWYKPTVLIDRVTTCVMALTQVKSFAWWLIWSNGIMEVMARIHRTIGHNPSTNAATLAYAVLDQLYE